MEDTKDHPGQSCMMPVSFTQYGYDAYLPHLNSEIYFSAQHLTTGFPYYAVYEIFKNRNYGFINRSSFVSRVYPDGTCPRRPNSNNDSSNTRNNTHDDCHHKRSASDCH
jgi:hypothetical protein